MPDPLNDYMPLWRLLPYESYDPDTQVFYNQHSMGVILSVSPMQGIDTEGIELLRSFLTETLIPGADLQWILWASPHIGNTLAAFEQYRAQQGGLFAWLANQRVQFLQKAAHHPPPGLGVCRHFQLFWVISLPKKSKNLAPLLACRQSLISTLETIHLSAHPLPITSFLSLLHDWLHPSPSTQPHQARWNQQANLSQQLQHPEYQHHIEPTQWRIEHQEKSYALRCLTVKQFPEQAAQWEMGELIGHLFNEHLALPCPVWVSFHLRILDPEKSQAKAQIHALNKTSKAQSPLARFLPTLTQEAQDWSWVRDALQGGDRLVKTHYQILLCTPSEQADQHERKIRDLYRASGWTLTKPQYLQGALGLSALPFMMSEGCYQDLDRLGCLHTLTAHSAINLAPLQGEWQGTPTPALLLPGRRGQLATWHPFDSQSGNYNIAIAAKSGSGKSVFTQEYLVALLGSGAKIWVIDAGRSYEKTCQLFGGEFLCFSPKTPMSLNPFTQIQDITTALPLLKTLLCAMARPTGGLSREEENLLEKALQAAWQAKAQQATIADLITWLNTQPNPVCQNLSLLLYPYTAEGMYGGYFQGPCTLSLDNPLLVLELQELKNQKELQKIVLLVMMYHITHAMYQGNRHQIKSCIIDEAWDLLGGDFQGAAQFIETGYRTARRFRGNFVTITQSLNDYYKNPTAQAALENSDYQVILAQKPESLQQLKQQGRLEMDDFTQRLYQSLKKTNDYAECIIKSPQGLSVHRIVLDPCARILYSSKGEEFEAVNALCEQGASLQSAVEQVAAQVYAT